MYGFSVKEQHRKTPLSPINAPSTISGIPPSACYSFYSIRVLLRYGVRLPTEMLICNGLFIMVRGGLQALL